MMGTGMLKLIPRSSSTVPSSTGADNKKRNHVLNSPTDGISSPSRSTSRLMHRDNGAMVREKKIVVPSDHNKTLKCNIASGSSSTVGSPIRQPDLADPSMCTSSSSKGKNIVDQRKILKLMRLSDRPSKVLANQLVDKPTPAPASSTILRQSSIMRTPLQAGSKPDRGRNIANADLRCISKTVDMVQNADSTDHGRKSDHTSKSTTSTSTDCPLRNDIITVFEGESKQTDHDGSARSDDIHELVLDMGINGNDEGRNDQIVELDLSASNAAGYKAPQGKPSRGSTDSKAKTRQIKDSNVKTDVKTEESASKKIFSNRRNVDQKRPCKINVPGGINPGSHCDASKATAATRLEHDEIPMKTIAKPKSDESHSKYNKKALTIKDHGRAFRHINHNNFQLGSSAQDMITISGSSRTNDGKLRLRSMHACKYTDPQDLVDQSICLADIVSEEHQKALDDHDRRLTSSNSNDEFVTSRNECPPSMNRENWPMGPLYYCSPPPSSLPFPKFSIPNKLKEHVLLDEYSTLPWVPMIEQQIHKKSPSTSINGPVNHAPPVSSYDVTATKGLRRMLNLDP